MKYVHPKLPRKAVETDGMENFFHIMFEGMLLMRSISKNTVEALGFQPVEEDRIENVCNNFGIRGDEIGKIDRPETKSNLRRTIEQYMPKVTISELDEMIRNTISVNGAMNAPYFRVLVIELLKSKNLLKE